MLQQIMEDYLALHFREHQHIRGGASAPEEYGKAPDPLLIGFPPIAVAGSEALVFIAIIGAVEEGIGIVCSDREYLPIRKWGARSKQQCI